MSEDKRAYHLRDIIVGLQEIQSSGSATVLAQDAGMIEHILDSIGYVVVTRELSHRYKDISLR